MSDEPPFLPVGTEISAKFKGAFCEAKVKKLVRNVKCKVNWKDTAGGSAIVDEGSVKGTIRVGAIVDVVHPETKQLVNAVIQSIKDCSTYTVVFDDGDERVLRRTQMVLKGGKHFHASESLDVMPLTKPEQFGAPVLGRRKGRRRKRPTGASAAVDTGSDSSSVSDDERDDLNESIDSGTDSVSKKGRSKQNIFDTGSQSDYGRVVCVYEQGIKDLRRWFPALIVNPKVKRRLKIDVSEEYLVRSFKDNRYLVIPKCRVQEFNLAKGKKVDSPSIRQAIGKAVLYLEKDRLPRHWDRELLLGDQVPSEDDESAERASPGSGVSAADVDDEASTKTKSPGSDNNDEKSSSNGSESPSARNRPSDASESDDPHSPEVGRPSKTSSMMEKSFSESPSPQRTSGTSLQRKRTLAVKRDLQRHKQSRQRKAARISSERKDRFVAQLYKFMEERGTPINKAPILAGKELDLYLFYDTVKKLGGYNRVNHKNEWRTVVKKMKLTATTPAAVKAAYNRYLLSFDGFYRKLGCPLSDLYSPTTGSRISRRERHASKSGGKPQVTVDKTSETSKKPMPLKTQTAGKEGTSKFQKSHISPAAVSKSVSLDANTGRTSPKAPGSREASKERSPASPPLPSRPPVADEDLIAGARVKVQYGSGSNKKLYQAKIMKIEDDRYVVHYLGWNTRYDEAVPKTRIVEVLSTVAAASSDSGVSNNDQADNSTATSAMKIMRSHSRSQAEKSFFRRRRSSGGSTHSLPIGAPSNDEANVAGITRKSSSITNAQFQKTEVSTKTEADDDDESGKESGALLSTYKPKIVPASSPVPVVPTLQNTSIKRPASASAAAEREKLGETSTDVEPAVKRARKTLGTSTPSSKRKKSLDDSDEEEETKNGGNGRRVSKRLRGVKASIEEELCRQQEDIQSEDEEEKLDETTISTTVGATVKNETPTVTVVATQVISAKDSTSQSSEAIEVNTTVTITNEGCDIGNEKSTVSSDENVSVDQSSLESTVPTEESVKEEISNQKEEEQEKDIVNAPVGSSISTVGQATIQKTRTTKMRRRRRNYSHMVTDHRNRPSANKTAKKDVDSDGEGGPSTSSGANVSLCHTGGRHVETGSSRDPNSLQALRHRIQADMDADPLKYKSNYTFNIIDESLDSERKIQVMQSNITELKETYLRIRAELSQLEKCRKKILENKRKQEKRASKSLKKALALSNLAENGTKPSVFEGGIHETEGKTIGISSPMIT